jgi:hypothetical protein
MISRIIRQSAGALFAATILFTAGVTVAGTLTRAEVDAAISAKVDLTRIRACAANPKGEFAQRVETTDLNKDGREEIIVYSTIYSLSQCLGERIRQADLLISDDQGNWQVTNLAGADDLVIKPRPDSVWPDFAADDYSGCMPVWRHDGKSYQNWKYCSNGQLLDAGTTAAITVVEPERTPNEGNGSYPVQVVDLKTFQGMPFDHNGSMMLVSPDRGMIVYLEPKTSIARTVKPGTVLFRGKPWNMDGETAGVVLDGIAFTFKRGCDAAGYTVRGRFSLMYGRNQFELEGPAPVRMKKGCAVPYYDIASPNATLTFDLALD